MCDSALRCKRSLSATSRWVVFSDRTKDPVGGKEKKIGFYTYSSSTRHTAYLRQGCGRFECNKITCQFSHTATTTIISTGNTILVLI